MSTATPTVATVDFPAMGGRVRLTSTDAAAQPALDSARELLHHAAARLSRFRADSELCALNADPRRTVEATPLLRACVRAMVRAHRVSRGLVDAAMLGELERAGYATSRAPAAALPLAEALALAPARRPARARPDAPWPGIRVDDRARTITRPLGVRLDSGGVGKGLLADMLARRLEHLVDVAIDCCGDVRIAGPRTGRAPREVEIVHPLTGDIAGRVWLGNGAIATSGLDRHLWPTAEGGVAHHLLDPATGSSAWTGLIGATAIAANALDAETLAKTALLSGPDAGRAVLRHGGVLFHDDGHAEGVGVLAEAVA